MASRIWWRRVRWLLALIALCAMATCPQGWRACRADRDAREAERLVGYMIARVRAVHAATGSLPRVGAGPTPALGACCDNGGTCAVDIAHWRTPGWTALGFTIDGEHRYSYSYAPKGTGAVITAIADKDCDGVTAIVEAELTIGGDGKIGVAWRRQLPSE